MNDFIEETAKWLTNNDALGSYEDHMEEVQQLYAWFESSVSNRGYSEDIPAALFQYVLNHHSFDLGSREELKKIIHVLSELVCPFAVDDERSLGFLEFVRDVTEKRIEILK